MQAFEDDAMTKQISPSQPPPQPRAPDPILAELWEVKRQINAEAGYRIEVLAQMADDAAERFRRKGGNLEQR